MKNEKLSIALAMSFALILAVSGYVGNTGENADIKLFSAVTDAFTIKIESKESDRSKRIYIADCNDIMDDLCADRATKSDALLAYAHIEGTANADGGDDDPSSCADPMDDLCDI